MDQFAHKLQKLVWEKGNSTSAVAKRLGISSQLLGQYIKGRQKPKAEFYIKWKQTFGDDLLNYDQTNVSRETASPSTVVLPLGDLQVTLKDHFDLLNRFNEKVDGYAATMQRIIEAKLLEPGNLPATSSAPAKTEEQQDEDTIEGMRGASPIVLEKGGNYPVKKKKAKKVR